jgi:MFS family permease
MASKNESVPLLLGAAKKAPPPLSFSFVVLAILSLLCFGSYFAYDSIQNLAPILKREINLSDTKFGALYAVYSFPNMILPFFGGVAGDKLGLRLAALVFVTLVVLGTALVAIAPLKALGLSDESIFVTMAAGRTLFGAGAESLNVTQIAMISEWFRDGKMMSMAFALALSMSRLGDFLAVFFGARIANAFGGFEYTLLAASALTLLSFVGTLLYFFIDKWSQRRYHRNKPEPQPFGWNNFKCVAKFDVRFWIISFLCMVYYAAIMPMISMMSGWLHNKYGYDEETAGWLTSIVILASMVLSPFLGKSVDVVGRRPLIVALGSLLLLPAHVALTITGPAYAYTIFPLWPIIAIGLSFSIVPSALWPCVPLVIPEEQTATAFGTMTAIQNFGLFLVSLLVNWIREHRGDESAMLFFVCADCLGLAGAVVLFLVDRRKGGALSMIKGSALLVVPAEAAAFEEYDNPFDDVPKPVVKKR